MAEKFTEGASGAPQLLPGKVAHPLNERVWRATVQVVAGCLLSWLALRFVGLGSTGGLWVTALLLMATWVGAIRLVLLDSWARRFWVVWLIAGSAPVLIMAGSPTGRVIAVTFAAAFLLFRRYTPYWHLATGRRARIFFAGLICLTLLSVDWEFPGPGELVGLQALARSCAGAALGALRLFWIFSLLSIFFRMRLHFMRLKPKLAVSALFVAIVPLTLVIILAVLAAYGTQGGSRAARAHAILHDWVRLVEQRVDLPADPFSTALHWRSDRGLISARGTRPAWLEEFAERVVAPGRESAEVARDSLQVAGDSPRELGNQWVPADTTAFFRISDELWLMRLEGVTLGPLDIHAFRIDEGPFTHLANMLGCDAGLYAGGVNITAGDEEIDPFIADSTAAALGLQGRFRPPGAAPDSAGGPWHRPLHFGGDLMDVIRPADGGFIKRQVLLHLKVRLSDLTEGFLVGEFQFNTIVIVGLAVLAVFFLILEGFALFFGIRITAGITGAVAQLHRGTVRLAHGDMQTRIVLPNEDEFGDLAVSFNAMIAAVDRARVEAVTRERLERELQMAREIQERLLPDQTPTVPGFELTGISLPSRQVGGDYFDFLAQGSDRVGIAIGDVSGKGIPAAMLMSNLQASLQGQVIHPSSVADVVTRVNNLLVRSTDAQMFATFFYGVLDRNTGSVTTTNAGHNPPILRRADGSIELLRQGGLLLGMLGGMPYEQETVTLEAGDVLVLYTDGITEAEGPLELQEPGQESSDEKPEAENMFGEERLQAIVQANAHKTAVGIREAILSAVTRHTAGVPQSDDITLVVIKRQSAASTMI